MPDHAKTLYYITQCVRKEISFQWPTSMILLKFRIVFWDVLPCKIIIDRRFKSAARASKTSVDNYFTRQYIPEDYSELHTCRRENLKSHDFIAYFFDLYSRVPLC
jgi:hypothetical protein